MTHNKAIYLAACWILLVLLGACNKNSDTTVQTNVSYSTTSTLVQNFALQANKDIAANLDSVHFTIDQDKAIIYNADSLPVGTNVTSLKVVLTFGANVRSAQFKVTGATKHSDTTFTYTNAQRDSIDFTGNVALTITSYDSQHTRTYTVKVNVHKLNPDSLMWNTARRRHLPGVTGTPAEQRTIVQNGTFYTLLRQQDNSLVLSSTDNPAGEWSSTTLTLPFAPQVESFAATTTAFFLLADDGTLYCSEDHGLTWSGCGVTWHSLLGAYGDKVLGVALNGGTYFHDEYPRDEYFVTSALPLDFPVEQASPLVEAANSWTANPQAMLMGGVTAEKEVTNAVWGYDGYSWARINGASSALPALRGAMLFPYVTYRVPTGKATPVKLVTWMVMGGAKADGTMNTTVYTSFDQGLLWAKGATGLQWPAHFTPCRGAQALIYNEDLSRDGVEWTCPFIYVFGGYAAGGDLLNNVWQGVLNRLYFKPVY